jgi:membrane protein implicated in regulation of membrane protease activity
MVSGTAGLVHVGVATAAAMFVAVVTDLAVWQKAVLLIAGLLLGSMAGLASVRQLEGRVDRAGGIVLYFEDTLPYSFVFALGLLSLAPFAFAMSIRAVYGSPGFLLALQAVLSAIAGAWLAHEVVVAGWLRREASRLGPLKVQWFYARSAVGPEAMVGKTGVVTTQCCPTGYVRIAGELWRAQSLDGTRLDVGQQVIVRRLNGLVVLIDSGDSMASNKPQHPTTTAS